MIDPSPPATTILMEGDGSYRIRSNPFWRED